MGITETVLLPLLRADAARPLITHYDDAEDSRVELSVTTTANWAAKTANWLRDEADVAPGTPVACALPPHWQTLGILLGAWWAGATVTTEPAGAAVAFVPPGSTAPGATLVAEVSLHPMGLGLDGEPGAGAVDFIEDSRPCGDDFTVIDPATGDTPAIGSITVAHALETATARAAELGVEHGTRVLCSSDWTIPDGLVDVLAVLTGGGALVQSSATDEQTIQQRAVTEHATVRLG